MTAETDSPFAFRDLTDAEMDELRRARMDERLRKGYFVSEEPPWTPSEARWHAKRFIAKNGRDNLVRMLAESYLALQDAVAGRE